MNSPKRADDPIWAFVAESNRIEGIYRAPTKAEIEAHFTLLELEILSVADLQRFVSAVQPDAVLRERSGLNVYVGDHIPPPGSPEIRLALARLLHRANQQTITPYAAHIEYETLHPFMDGNGRSGRAVWLWMMKDQGDLSRPMAIGFLHSFYYQTLANAPARAGEG